MENKDIIQHLTDMVTQLEIRIVKLETMVSKQVIEDTNVVKGVSTYTTTQLAALLGFSKLTIFNWINNGTVTAHRANDKKGIDNKGTWLITLTAEELEKLKARKRLT